MAVKNTIYQFTQGARFGAHLRFQFLRALLKGGVSPSTLAGTSAQFKVGELMDIRRARTLFGEEHVIEWLINGFDEDVVFWDVGAYHGHYSVIAALNGADVVAFEPAAENRNRIQQNLSLNNVDTLVDIKPVALSSETKSVQFGGNESSEYTIGGGDTMVKTIRGDEVEPSPNVVKIDVEGHELEVLDGLAGHFDYIERIAIEVHEGVQVNDVIIRLRDSGMKVNQIGPRKGQNHISGVR